MTTQQARTLADFLSEKISELDPSSVLGEFQVHRLLAEIEKLKKVDALGAYMFEGMVYSMNGRVDLMKDSFRKSMNLTQNGSVVTEIVASNYATALSNYSYFDEAIQVAKPFVDFNNNNISTFKRICYQALLAQLKFEEACVFAPDTKAEVDNIQKRIEDIGINLNDAQALSKIFFNVIREQKLRSVIVGKSFDLVLSDEINMMISVVASAEDTKTLLSRYDHAVIESRLSEVADKFNIIAIPFWNIKGDY